MSFSSSSSKRQATASRGVEITLVEYRDNGQPPTTVCWVVADGVTFTLGKGTSSDIVVPVQTGIIKTEHCRLTNRAGVLEVQILASDAAVRLSGSTLMRMGQVYQVKAGDKLHVGVVMQQSANVPVASFIVNNASDAGKGARGGGRREAGGGRRFGDPIDPNVSPTDRELIARAAKLEEELALRSKEKDMVEEERAKLEEELALRC